MFFDFDDDVFNVDDDFSSDDFEDYCEYLSGAKEFDFFELDYNADLLGDE